MAADCYDADEDLPKPLSESNRDDDFQPLEEFQSYSLMDRDLVVANSQGHKPEAPNCSTNEEGEGVMLTEELVATGLSDLSRTSDGLHVAFLQLSLVDCCLGEVEILRRYEHIQKLDLSHNSIRDISWLCNMTLLEELNVSYNQISGTLLDLKLPLCNLRVADFSHNKISALAVDYSKYQRLSCLNLSVNCIERIQGLSTCTGLKVLNLSNNNIGEITCLDCLSLTHLNMGWNALMRIENIDTLKHLQNICLAGNRIRSLHGLEDHPVLLSIDLAHNEVIDLSEIVHVGKLPMLESLDLTDNPVVRLPDYRLSVLFTAPQICTLDGQNTSIEEKVAACNLFSPSMELLAARDHIMHRVYAFLQPQRISDLTLPVLDVSYPMLILVGPQGMGKKSLAMKICADLPEYFGYSPCHTTRQIRQGEQLDSDYCFVSEEEFERRIKCGQFLETYTVHGDLYGLSLATLESVAESSAVCVTHMELEGVLSLTRLAMRPRFVLLLPCNGESLERRLYEKGHWGQGQIKVILNRVHMYSEHHQQHPGFFDAVIRADDIGEMYDKLCTVACDLFGIFPSASHDHPASGGEAMNQSAVERQGSTQQSWTTDDALNQNNYNSSVTHQGARNNSRNNSLAAATDDDVVDHGVNATKQSSANHRELSNSSFATHDVGVVLDRWGGEWWRGHSGSLVGQNLRGGSAPPALWSTASVAGSREHSGGMENQQHGRVENIIEPPPSATSSTASSSAVLLSAALSTSTRSDEIANDDLKQVMAASRRRLEVKIREQLSSSSSASYSERRNAIGRRPGTPHVRIMSKSAAAAVESSSSNCNSCSQSGERSMTSCPSSTGHARGADSRQMDLSLVGLLNKPVGSSVSNSLTSEGSSVPKCPRPEPKEGGDQQNPGWNTPKKHQILPPISSTA